MPNTGSIAPTDWHLREGNVALCMPSGVVVKPTAVEVVGAEYKQRLSIRGETVARRPSEAMPGVTFARYPLEVVLEITPPAADLSVPARCSLRGLEGRRPIEATLQWDNDQVLVGAKWFPLDAGALAETRTLLEGAGVSAPGLLTCRQYLQLRSRPSDLIRIGEAPAAGIGLPSVARPPSALPDGLKAQLYPYQRDGFVWLCRVSDEELGCILADQMGLGKTLQVIALILREIELRKQPSLVIAPATLLENWRRELARFAPALTTSVHRGHARTGFPRELRIFNVVITSYETAMRDISILEMIRWNIVVLDEAQAIKTPGAQRTVTLKTIPRRMSLAVSGTPVENRLRDLWSLMDFAVPGLLGTLDQFEERYEDSNADAASLEPLVSPLILRRLVADVAKDLPERIDIPQAVEMSAEAVARYDAIRTETMAQYGAVGSLVALTRLRMFCTHPFLIDEGAGDPLPLSTKYARLVEILDETVTQGEKSLIFTSYTEMADILEQDLVQRFGVPCRIIDGRTPVTDRQPAVDQFGRETGAAILILNPKAAGTGLNITAANHVIHYNLEWNPALEDQATARAYRRGQERPVTVHHLFHPGTVEEIIDQRMQRKRSLAAQAVIGTEGGEEDLADILRAMQLSPAIHGGTYGD